MVDSDLLARLSESLQMSGMPTQLAISKTLGLDQPFVSRAKRGELKRVTARVRLLCDYADRRRAEIERHEDPAARAAHAVSPAMRDALSECRAYLEDGCDPLVLREQIALLRRVQGLVRRDVSQAEARVPRGRQREKA